MLESLLQSLTADADVLGAEVPPPGEAAGPAHLAGVVVGGAVGGADRPHHALAPLGARAARDALPRRLAEAAVGGAAQVGALVQTCDGCDNTNGKISRYELPYAVIGSRYL